MNVKEKLKECAVPYAAIKVKKLINMLETEKDLKFDLRYYTNDGLWYESYGQIVWENPDNLEEQYYFGVKVEGNETEGIFSFENIRNKESRLIETFEKLKCRPCSKDGRGKCLNFNHLKCLTTISPERVISLISDLEEIEKK